MKTIYSVLAATIAMFMLSGAASPAPAAAHTADDISAAPTLLVRDYTNLGLCLRNSRGVQVVGAHCTPSDPYQEWRFVQVQEGSYQIRGNASGLCLQASSENGDALVVPAPCHPFIAQQQWTHDISAVGGKTFRQIILARTNLAMSVLEVGAPARIRPRCGCQPQFWSRLNH